MKLRKIIFRLLPLDLFIKLRRYYRIVLKKVFRPLSEKEFRVLLTERLGLKKGSVVFIHSSFDSLNIQFDVLRLLEILIETVGEEGTLLFPAWHFTYRAEEYLLKNLVFDVKHSPSALGLLSDMARRHPDAIRSVHPINSIVAIGKYAKEITNQHGSSIYPCDETSPYFKMMTYRGQIIGLGVNTHFLSFVHCPEDVMKNQFPVKTRLDKVFEARVKEMDGKIRIVKTLVAHPQVSNNDITGFLNKYVDSTICENFSIRGNRFFRADSLALFEEIAKLAKENKTIYTVTS